MHKKFFIVTAIVLAVAAGLASAVAQVTQNGRQGRHSGWMLQHMAAQLNLTEAQQAQIKNILQAEKAKTQPLRQQLHQNRLAETANASGTFDEAQVRAFADKQAQLMSDLMVERERAKSQMFAVLTPDQRQKALALMQQRQQRGRHRGHKSSGPTTSATPS